MWPRRYCTGENALFEFPVEDVEQGGEGARAFEVLLLQVVGDAVGDVRLHRDGDVLRR